MGAEEVARRWPSRAQIVAATLPALRRILVNFTIARRNVVRQRRRSALALAVIGFGVAALMLATGFIEWNFEHYREAMIHSQLGHLRIHRAGYSDGGLANPFRFLLPDNAPERATVLRQEGVVALAPRVSLSGLASRGEVTLPYIGEGVDPEAEGALAESVTVITGEPLSASDPAGIIMGQGLAANLGVHVGDQVVLMANTERGAVNAVEVHVRGTFATITKAYDDVALRLPLAKSQSLLRIKGAHSWVLLLDDTSRTKAVLDSLGAALDPRAYELVPWWKLSDFYNKSAELFAKQVWVMKLIVALLIILSISNTLMMNVMERTGEIGTAMALGANRVAILQRFVAEGVVLGVLGAITGLVFGYGMARLISWIGIPVPPPPGMAIGYIGGILVTAPVAIDAVVLAVVTAFVASVYPAWKASRMVIVDALRTNRA